MEIRFRNVISGRGLPRYLRQYDTQDLESVSSGMGMYDWLALSIDVL